MPRRVPSDWRTIAIGTPPSRAGHIRARLFALATESDWNRPLAKKQLHLARETFRIDVGARRVAHTGGGDVGPFAIPEAKVSFDQRTLSFWAHLCCSILRPTISKSKLN